MALGLIDTESVPLSHSERTSVLGEAAEVARSLLRLDLPPAGDSAQVAQTEVAWRMDRETKRTYEIGMVRWPIAGTLGLGGATPAGAEGYVAIAGEQVLLACEFSSALSTDALASELGIGSVRWPTGMDGMAKVTSGEEGAVSWWAHKPRGDREIPSRELSRSWPMQVSSWSDGRWWLLSVSLPQRTDRMAKRPGPPLSILSEGAFLELPGRPGSILPPAAHPAELRPVAAYADLASRMRPGPLPGVVRPDPGSSLDVADELLRQLPEADRPPTITADQWAQANTADPPAVVTEYFGRQLEPTLSLENAGLYWIEKASYPYDGLHWPSESAVRWQTAPGKLFITLVRRNAARQYQDRTGAPRHHGFGVLPEQIPALLGEYGQRIVLVPNSNEDVGNTDWEVMSPKPDTMVGWDGDIRVGDTPWGKCRVYYHPCVLYVVFDL
jgi:hypothetical protein